MFLVASHNSEFLRVYGAVYLPTVGYAFPAFYPFHAYVVHDLKLLDVPTELSPESLLHAATHDRHAELIQQRKFKEGFKFHTKPYEHQLDATAFAIYNLRSALLLHPGLGKTKCAIDTVRHEGGRVLSVVPRVILHKWADEILLHGGGELKPVVIDGTPKKKKQLIGTPGDVHICTYGTAASMTEEIMEQLEYDTIIIDESHNLQTYNSAKTKAVSYLAKKAARRILMSGTAALGDPRHLYGQLDTLGKFLHEENFWKFSNRYVVFKEHRSHRIPVGYKNLDILNNRMRLVGISRTKEECLDLPDRMFIPFHYTLSTPQKDYYNELVRASTKELEEKLRVIEDATPTARLTKLLQVCSGWVRLSNKDPRICDRCHHMRYCVNDGIRPYTTQCSVQNTAPEPTLVTFKENPKMAALQEILEEVLLAPENKIVIWARFLQELTDVEALLSKLGLGYVRVDGSVSTQTMSSHVKEFQTQPGCRVYLGQISTGVGIDLTAANYMCYYSLTHNLGDWIQSQDRSYRIGQTRNLTVYTLINRASIEGDVYEALMNKQDISAALLNKDPTEQTEFERKITRPSELP